MVMITVSSFMAITVIHISHRVDKVNKLPEWVKTVRLIAFEKHIYVLHL